jgi:addiction module HigA family antidote
MGLSHCDLQVQKVAKHETHASQAVVILDEHHHREQDRRFRDISASASTCNGESASGGLRTVRMMWKSWTVTRKGRNMANKMRPIHPGEILREELLELGLSANTFAAALGVPTNRIAAILNEKRSITADTALMVRNRSELSASGEARLIRSLNLCPQLRTLYLPREEFRNIFDKIKDCRRSK